MNQPQCPAPSARGRASYSDADRRQAGSYNGATRCFRPYGVSSKPNNLWERIRTMFRDFRLESIRMLHEALPYGYKRLTSIIAYNTS